MMIGLTRFNNLKLLYKMTIVSTIGVLLFLAGILFFILPKLEAKIMQEKKLAAEQLVEMATSIIQGYTGDNRDEGQVRSAALRDISKLRYDGSNYVWISDLKSSMVMHPIKPALNGKDMGDFTDPAGKRIFHEFAKAVQQDGEGYVHYLWPKPGHEKPVSKISYLKLYPKWGWILGTGIYIDDVKSQIVSLKTNIIVISLLIGLFVVLFSYLMSRNIARRLSRSVRFAKRVADGDFRQTMDIHQTDEIGTLAAALNDMVANLRGMFEKITGSVTTLSSSSTGLSTISQQISAGTEQNTGKTQSVTAAAEGMSADMLTVAAAAEQTATNVQMVATAAEQMTATINEISGNSEKGRAIACEAVEKARLTSAQVDELGSTVQQIGQVTETITDISEQTNLLALNATIEAARAGEAGKGFAVVACEIKDLANQTAVATKKIANQINNIQLKTDDTVGKIDEITTVINDLSDIVTTLASAMEEQSAATAEIANNVSQAAQGNEEVTRNVTESSGVAKNIARDMAEVNQSSQEIAGKNAQVFSSARELATMAEQLNRLMGEFTL
jgi:methyl-accepting chemotaxis protein